MGWGPPKKPREPLTESALFDYATASLARRAQTVAELKRKLRTRIEPGEAGEQKIAAVVAKLKDYRFLNDASFAADYTKLRQENDKLGRRRVQQGLMQKGVHPKLVTSTLEAAYENVNEERLARDYIERANWVVTFPGLAILTTVLAINLMGDGLRDALDPRMKKLG